MICKCASGGSMYSLEKNMKKVPFWEAVNVCFNGCEMKKKQHLFNPRSNFALAANQTIIINCTIFPFLLPPPPSSNQVHSG